MDGIYYENKYIYSSTAHKQSCELHFSAPIFTYTYTFTFYFYILFHNLIFNFSLIT